MLDTKAGPLFKSLIQVGMVVPDLNNSMHNYVFGYGVGPMYVLEFNHKNVDEMYLYGKKKNYSMNLGVCPMGDVRFELIEPITRSIYSDYLKKYGQGIIHHLKLAVEDYYEAIGYLESSGIDIIQSGHQLGGKGKNMYTYLDTTETLGFIIEVVNIEEEFVKPEPERWFPEDGNLIPDPVFKRTDQVGIVVKNLKEKIGKYSDLFGLRPWDVREFNYKNTSQMYLYGRKKNYSAKVGFYDMDGVQFKIIEPLSDSIFSDFLDKYGEGIVHHLGMEVNEYDQISEYLRSKDIDAIQSGIYKDRIRFSYYATQQDINFIVEIVEENRFRNIL